MLLRRLDGETVLHDDVDDWTDLVQLKSIGWMAILEDFYASHDVVLKYLEEHNDDVLVVVFRRRVIVLDTR